MKVVRRKGIGVTQSSFNVLLGKNVVSTLLLGEVYNASINPTLWPEVLDKCVYEVGAKSGALLRLDALSKSGYQIQVLSKHTREGLTEQDLNYWVTELSKYDEIGLRYGMTVPAGTVYRDVDVNPDVRSLDSQPDFVFLREKLGIRRKLAARLLDNHRYITTLGFQFPSDISNVPDISVTNMSQLVPHVAKAIEIGIIYDKLQATYSKVLAALDYVGLGICIADSAGHLIVANKEANRILDSGQGVRVNRSKILTCSSENNSRALEEAISQASISRNITVAERIIPIRVNPQDEPVLIEISPLRDHYEEIEMRDDSVLIQMIDIGCYKHCSVESFGKAYQLTPAEQKVCKLMTEGLTNNEIAEIRNKSIETIKSQAKLILKKANVSSRIELIKKVLKTDPPVFGYDDDR